MEVFDDSELVLVVVDSSIDGEVVAEDPVLSGDCVELLEIGGEEVLAVVDADEYSLEMESVADSVCPPQEAVSNAAPMTARIARCFNGTPLIVRDAAYESVGTGRAADATPGMSGGECRVYCTDLALERFEIAGHPLQTHRDASTRT